MGRFQNHPARWRTLACLVATAWGGHVASAATIVNFPFTTGSLAPTITNPDGLIASVTDLSQTGLSTWTTTSAVTNRSQAAGDVASDSVTIGLGTSSVGAWRSGGSAAGSPGTANLQTPSTVDRSQYFGFTITPSQEVVLQSLAMDFWKPSDSSNRGFSIWYSYGGDFNTNSREAGWFQVLSTTTVGAQAVRFSLDIAALDGSATSSPVEFRFYSISSTNNELRYDNVSLSVAAVPEPGVQLAAGLAVLTAWGARWQRRRSVLHGNGV